MVVKQESGGEVLIVQAYAYGKYLGLLEVTFDEAGVVTEYGGNPILLDNKVEQGQIIKSFLLVCLLSH